VSYSYTNIYLITALDATLPDFMGLWLYLCPKLNRMNNSFVTIASHQISFKIMLEAPSCLTKVNDSNAPELFGVTRFFFFDIETSLIDDSKSFLHAPAPAPNVERES